MNPRAETLASRLIARRYWVIAAWAIGLAAASPLASRVKESLSVAASVPGSESAHVEELIRDKFASGFAQYAVLVVTDAPSPRDSAGRNLLVALRDSLLATPYVSGTFSYLDLQDTIFVGPRGETFMIVGLDPGTKPADDFIPLLRQLTHRLSRSLIPESRVKLQWTGEIALNHDLRAASAADAAKAEQRVLPVTVILLVIAFGALAAAILPVVSGGLAIVLALGAAAAIGRLWPLSILLQNVVTMLGLGLGIDYALLVVARFRESLEERHAPFDAAVVAATAAGRTIMLSGASVAIGFCALLAVPVNEIRSLAIGGLLVILMAVLISTTLLPSLLAVLGERVNWGSIRRIRARRESSRWRSWGTFVCAHPLIVLFAAGIPTGVLALQATRLSSDLPRGDWLPPRMESARALRTLGEMGKSGVVNGIRVVVHLPAGSPWDSPSGWAALDRATDKLAADPRIAGVRSLPAATGLVTPNLQLLALSPAPIRDALGSRDGRAAIIELMPAEAAAQHGAIEIVRSLRAQPAIQLTGLEGTSIEVGGLPAFNVDYQSAVGDSFWNVVLAVVTVTMLALMIAFRSVLIAIKAVALNLLSVAAAFGALVLVFQEGHGLQLLGLATPLDGTFTAIPVIVFCVVFGLSMDYEVFLVARVAEARRAGADDDAAIVEGLARTGGMITSAAAIMIVVFGAFTLGDFVIVKILGFTLAVAVLVDATVMRVAIGPALLALGGRWNWWPGSLHYRRSTAKIRHGETKTRRTTREQLRGRSRKAAAFP